MGGLSNITEKVVKHQARKFGETKFGLERLFLVLDLFSITFIGKFGKDQCTYLAPWDLCFHNWI